MAEAEEQEQKVILTQFKDAIEARGALNAAFREVLARWRQSDDEAVFPEELVKEKGRITYENSLTLDSFPKRVAAQVLEKALKEGLIYVGVSPVNKAEIVKVGLFKKDDSEKILVAAYFTYNADERALSAGVSLEEIAEDTLTRLLYWDAKCQRDEVTRIVVKNEPDFLVSLVKTK